MKRIITSALSALFVAVLLGVTGCEGSGGVDPGMPADTSTTPLPPDEIKAIAPNMATQTPPSSVSKKGMPAKGADTPPAPEKKD
jgi:hypothetical protein